MHTCVFHTPESPLLISTCKMLSDKQVNNVHCTYNCKGTQSHVLGEERRGEKRGECDLICKWMKALCIHVRYPVLIMNTGFLTCVHSAFIHLQIKSHSPLLS